MAPTDLLPTDSEESAMRPTRTPAISLITVAAALVAGLLLTLGGPAHSASGALADAVATPAPVPVSTATAAPGGEEPWN
ncbi:hypothetical protein [Kitasatospora sp. NPDC054795]